MEQALLYIFCPWWNGDWSFLRLRMARAETLTTTPHTDSVMMSAPNRRSAILLAVRRLLSLVVVYGYIGPIFLHSASLIHCYMLDLDLMLFEQDLCPQ